MMLKVVVVLILISSTLISTWKNSVGIFLPLACLWIYGYYEGFVFLSVTGLIILTVIHLLFQNIFFWYSNKYRQANLAFTGAGITGFATVLLASLFTGALLGFFTWWGLIGRLITEPVSIGVMPIVKSFAAGVLKVMYGLIFSGIVSYMIF